MNSQFNSFHAFAKILSFTQLHLVLQAEWPLLKVMCRNHQWKDDHWSFTSKKFQKDCKRKLAHQVQCSPTLPFHHDQDLREVISLPKILTTIPSCFSSVMASTSSSRRRSASSNGTTTEVSRSLAKPSAALPRTPDVRTYLS